MTVCIAAIAENSMVFGAADRMVTSGDIEFEPSVSKILSITNSIVVLLAGESTFHEELYQLVSELINDRIEREPENWWKVKDVADLYALKFNEAKLLRAEAAVLAPLGLNRQSFISQQNYMSDRLVEHMTNRMTRFQMPSLMLIIAGIDPTGAHIYTMINGEVICWDSVGFISVGGGWRHANSQFQFSGHTRRASWQDTIFLTYFAKRRAEVAPGVGKATDMIAITKLGNTIPIAPALIKEFDKGYTEIVNSEKKVYDKSRKEIQRIFDATAEDGEEPKQKTDESDEPGNTGRQNER